MGGGALQLLLQCHVPPKFDAANVLRTRRSAADRAIGKVASKPRCRASLDSSARFYLSGKCSPLVQLPASVRRGYFVTSQPRQKEGSISCSESRIAETDAVAPASAEDTAEASPEIVGNSYSSNVAAVLAPERTVDDYEDEKLAGKAQEVEPNLLAAEVIESERLGTDQQQQPLIEKDQSTENGSVKESLQDPQAERSSSGGWGDENRSLLDQMREIFSFAGPALGIWLSGPLMSLIDTAVVGNSSSLELAALGPGTVLCDQTCFVFMFLSIATSNLIATSLAHKDEAEAAGHLSRLLFVAFMCGMGMLLINVFFATSLIKAFVGPQNYFLIPAAQLYVQIRALAWPFVLMGMVAQSASLGMQDSLAPLRVLAIASSINLFGDILLCSVLGYGIGGAAWATMASQIVGTILMLHSLTNKGYNPLAIRIPSWTEFVYMVNLAGPILLTMLSKASFYTVITFLATSLGSTTLAAHQVMIGLFSLCTVCGEPLAQTAQSFMPALIYGSRRNLKQARALLRNLILMGTYIGLTLGCVGSTIAMLFPQIFTNDVAIASKMRSVFVPFFLSLAMTPPALCCEGTLLAGRDLIFLGLSMAFCFSGGSILLVTLHRLGVGLHGSWWTLVAFQTTRFTMAYTRLSGRKSVLHDAPSSPSSKEMSAQLS